MPERGEAGSGIRRIKWLWTPAGVSVAFGGYDICSGVTTELDEGTAERAVSAGLAEYVDASAAVAVAPAGAVKQRKRRSAGDAAGPED